MSNKTVSIDLSEIKMVFQSIETFRASIPELVIKIGLVIKGSITNRVQRYGMGVKTALSQYSIHTKNLREAKGRQTGFKDLTFTGRMMNSITVLGNGSSAKVVFGSKDEENKALGHEERGDVFFGIGNDEEVAINKTLEEAWAKL